MVEFGSECEFFFCDFFFPLFCCAFVMEIRGMNWAAYHNWVVVGFDDVSG